MQQYEEQENNQIVIWYFGFKYSRALFQPTHQTVKILLFLKLELY